MLQTPFLERLDSSLSGLVSEQLLACQGTWSTSLRRVYASLSQLGSGEGPFVEIIDARWNAHLSAEFAFGVMAFLATPREVYWSKASLISSLVPVQVSLSGDTHNAPGGSSFTGRAGEAYLPGVPVASGRPLEDVCTAEPRRLVTGRVARLAQTTEAEFFVVALPRAVLKVGRNHLWRVRDDSANEFPPDVRAILTRGRAGAVGHE
jgi:hypothetical protein